MDFLQNLMIRHQTEMPQLQAELPPAIVQPRQKLRFEGGSEPLVRNAEMNQESFSDLHVPVTDNTDFRPLSVPVFSELDTRSTSHNARLDNIDNRPDKWLDTKDQMPGSALDHQNGEVKLTMDSIGKILKGFEPMPRASRLEIEPHLIQPTTQLDMPQRLHPNEENRTSGITQNSDKKRTQNSSNQNKQHTAQHEAAARLINASQDAFATQTASSPTSPYNSGLLKAPDWLNQIQAELQDRWQALNLQAQAEPVINVTIGRVEVRAVQVDSPQPPRKKSTSSNSIMTLDSYLKQRDRRGPV